MNLTDADLAQLSTLTTRDEAGQHFMSSYSGAWLDRMESQGAIIITRPVHSATELPYSEEYYSVEVTPEAVAEGEARNWGEQ